MIPISDPDEFRKNICQKIHNRLISVCMELGAITPPFIKTSISVNIEKGIYNYTVIESGRNRLIKSWNNHHFIHLYIDRLRTIYRNLSVKNSELVLHIVSGELHAKHLATMTHQEFNPSQWSELLEKKAKKDESKMGLNIEASTDLFTCKKCKSTRCTFYELQTRSADEPATIFITCLDCGKHGKIS